MPKQWSQCQISLQSQIQSVVTTHESRVTFTTSLDVPMLALAHIDGHNSLPLVFITKSSKSLIVPLMLAGSYLGSHSQVLESGQGLGWFYLASNPKTKLASIFTTRSNSNKDEWNGLKYLRCGSTRTRAIAENNDGSRRPHTWSERISWIGATLVAEQPLFSAGCCC